MSAAFAVLTSDPNLLGCDLRRLEGQVLLSSAEQRQALGVGVYTQDEALLQRYPPEDAPRTLEALAPRHISEVLLAYATRLQPGRALDGGTQPLRLRHWLFCMVGNLNAFPRLRPTLMAELPEYLRRSVADDTPQELAFALFLKHLRELGRTDDRALEATMAARLLGSTARRLQTLAAEAGAARTSPFALFATNQRVLAACRSGEQPLFYRPLEGADCCERCGITASSPEANVRSHQRRKALALATELLQPAGWMALREGAAIAADVDGRVHVEPPPEP